MLRLLDCAPTGSQRVVGTRGARSKLTLVVGVAYAVALTGLARAQTTGHWRFEEGLPNGSALGSSSIIDTSASGNHGTPTGAPTYRADVPIGTVPATAALNTLSLEFDGADDSVSMVSMFPFHAPGDATIEFYLKSPFSGHQSIFWTRPDASDTDRFNFFVNGNGTIGFDYRSPGGTLHLLVGAAGTGIPIVQNSWTHIAITRQGNTYRLYVNATLAGSGVDSSPDLPVVAGWQMSGRPGSMFQGILDEVRLSSGALTPSQFLSGASVVSVGTGCGGDGMPALTCTPPQLGHLITLSLTQGTPNASGSIYYSTGILTGVIWLGSGCMLALDLPTAAPLTPVVTDPSGAWALMLLMPSDPNLLGVQVALQGALFGTEGPLGFDLSNGLIVTVGY
jgi:hypothetical protein